MNGKFAACFSVVSVLSCGVCIGADSPSGASRERKPLNYGRPLAELIHDRPLNKRKVRIKVEKSRYLLSILYQNEAVKSYPIVLGTHPVEDKRCEGDGRTPEGVFSIAELRSPHKWTRFLLLNYPTSESKRKFQEAKTAGKLPLRATIGGAIGIHGVPAGYDSAIEQHQNWTLGCISLKTHDIEEVYSVCRKGTKVEIVH